MYVALVPYSPPTDSPRNRRASNSNAGAHVPIVSYPGRQAITSEPTHIMHTEMSMDVLRPFLSAILPNSHPPMGRIRNPAAKRLRFAEAALWCSLTGKDMRKVE